MRISELANAAAQASPDDKMAIVMSKIKLLGQEYSGTPHCFSIGNYRLLFGMRRIYSLRGRSQVKIAVFTLRTAP